MTLTIIATGVDSSPLARSALRWSCSLANQTGAKMRVVGTWKMPIVGLLPLPVDGQPTREFMVEQCSSMIRDAIDDSGCVPDDVRCVEGKPGPTLLLATADSDLLVVGRTGQGKRRGVARLAEIVLGSTARHCVHHSDIPVVTVPAEATWPQHDPVAVVGLDGSPCAIRALEWALTALPADATVHVVRAFAPWVGDGLAPMDLANDADFIRAFEAETLDWVQAATHRVGARLDAAPQVSVRVGSPIDALLDSDLSPDLIVLGARGHTGISAKVLGSVADHVVRYAPCPVAIIPSQYLIRG